MNNKFAQELASFVVAMNYSNRVKYHQTQIKLDLPKDLPRPTPMVAKADTSTAVKKETESEKIQFENLNSPQSTASTGSTNLSPMPLTGSECLVQTEGEQ